MKEIIIPSLDAEILNLQKKFEDFINEIAEGTAFVGGYAGTNYKESETKIFLLRSGTPDTSRGVIFKVSFVGTTFLCQFVLFCDGQEPPIVHYERWYQRLIDEKELLNIKNDIENYINLNQFNFRKGL